MSDPEPKRRKRPTVTGTVLSAKMTDTIVVREDRRVRHPLYGKYMKRSVKYVAHDAGNTASEGDVVEISQTRPISKTTVSAATALVPFRFGCRPCLYTHRTCWRLATSLGSSQARRYI